MARLAPACWALRHSRCCWQQRRARQCMRSCGGRSPRRLLTCSMRQVCICCSCVSHSSPIAGAAACVTSHAAWRRLRAPCTAQAAACAPLCAGAGCTRRQAGDAVFVRRAGGYSCGCGQSSPTAAATGAAAGPAGTAAALCHTPSWQASGHSAAYAHTRCGPARWPYWLVMCQHSCFACLHQLIEQHKDVLWRLQASAGLPMCTLMQWTKVH